MATLSYAKQRRRRELKSSLFSKFFGFSLVFHTTLQQENTANSELLKKQSESDKQHVCNIERLFDLNRLKSDQNIAFYTGFPNYDTFTSFLNYLNPGTHGENIRYDREIPDDFYDITDGDEESENERNCPRNLRQ